MQRKRFSTPTDFAGCQEYMKVDQSSFQWNHYLSFPEGTPRMTYSAALYQFGLVMTTRKAWDVCECLSRSSPAGPVRQTHVARLQVRTAPG